MASTMSGMIIGAKSRASRAGDGLARATPSASRVPSTVAMSVDHSATISEFQRRAGDLRGSPRACRTIRSETPPQAVGRPDLLSDSTISTAMGR